MLVVSSFFFHLHLTKLIISLLPHIPLVWHKLLRRPYLLQASLVSFQQPVVTQVTERLRMSAFNARGTYVKQMVSSEVKTVTAAKGNGGANRTASKRTLIGEEETIYPFLGQNRKSKKQKQNKTKTALWFLQDLEYSGAGHWCTKELSKWILCSVE